MRQEFTFNGEHCDAHNAAFVADGWPVAAAATPNKFAVSGVHGTLRYPGKTYSEKTFSGMLYLLDVDNRVITYSEMLERTAELARWLCPEGRRELVLDAMPDRFYIGEVEAALTVQTDSWGNGAVPVTFVLQPFTYNRLEDSVSTQLTASARKTLTLQLAGSQTAPIGFTLTATGSVVNQVELAMGSSLLRFANLNLKKNQVMKVWYDLSVGEFMRAEVNGAAGMVFLQPESTVPFEASPGGNALSVLSSGACDIRVFARGRWH